MSNRDRIITGRTLEILCFALMALGGGMIGFGNGYGWILVVVFGVLWLSVGVFAKSMLGDSEFDLNARRSPELTQQITIERREGEPLPPWMEEPGADPFHVIWRMGAEGYLKEFYDYFLKLDSEQQTEYFSRYDLGPEWPDRDEWRRAVFRQVLEDD